MSTDVMPQASIREDVTVVRVAHYLSPIQVTKRKPLVNSKSYLGSVLEVFTAGFLSLPDDALDEPDLGIRSMMYNESMNIAIMGALLCAMIMPIWQEGFDVINGEDYAEVLKSYPAELLGEDWILSNIDYVEDVAQVCILMGAFGYATAAFFSTFIIIVFGQLPDESDVLVFMRRLSWAKKVPYYCLLNIGLVGFLGFGLRALLIPHHRGTWIATAIALIFGMYGYFAFLSRNIRSLYATVNERSDFEDVVLTDSQIREDLDQYFAKAGEKASLNHCLWMLSARSPAGSHLPMAAQTLLKIKVAYFKRVAPALGLDVSDGDVLWLASDNEVSF